MRTKASTVLIKVGEDQQSYDKSLGYEITKAGVSFSTPLISDGDKISLAAPVECEWSLVDSTILT